MTNSSAALPELLTAIGQVIGPERITQDHNDLETYGRDWTRVFKPAPSAIVFPATTDEVAEVVCYAQYNIPIVPSGGRTGSRPSSCYRR